VCLHDLRGFASALFAATETATEFPASRRFVPPRRYVLVRETA